MTNYTNGQEMLPLEYGLKEAFKIYKQRFLIFALVILSSSILLGFFLFLIRVSALLAMFVAVLLLATIGFFTLMRRRTQKSYMVIVIELYEDARVRDIDLERVIVQVIEFLIVPTDLMFTLTIKLSERVLQEIGVLDSIVEFFDNRIVWPMVVVLDRFNLLVPILNARMENITSKMSVKPLVIESLASYFSIADAILKAAHLAGVRLVEVNLVGGKLVNAILEGTDLTRANLTEAVMEGANLTKANLMDAVLERTNLVQANLNQANLRGTNLKGADLTNANLNGATYDETTIWPSGFDPELAGAIREV